VVRRSGSSTPSGNKSTHSSVESELSISLDTYDMVGPEYYNKSRHPTCADLRDASEFLLRKALRNFRPKGQSYCEVGCGDSLLLCELDSLLQTAVFTNRLDCNRIENLTLIDSAVSMLRYSTDRWRRYKSLSRWMDCQVNCVQADARHLPLWPSSVDILVSCLGDPYNEELFWREAARVLTYGGTAIFTTPSWEWASGYRSEGEQNRAIFELQDGRSIQLPSYILPEKEQVDLIESSGLDGNKLVVEDCYKFLLRQTRPRNGSKIAMSAQIIDPGKVIVTGYIVKRI